MNNRTIYITEADSERLLKILNDPAKVNFAEQSYLESLRSEIERAHKVKPEQIPADVITMNSRVRLLDIDSGEDEVCTLTFPLEADINESRISVLAPVGTAMLGYRVGDEFTWKVPSGERKLRVIEVLYQPEASGDFHL